MLQARRPSVPLHGILSAVWLFLLSMLGAGCASVQPQQTTTATPSIALSATSFNFNTVVVGQSAAQTLLISNTGTASLQLTGLSVSNQQFSITGPSLPRTILPSNSLSYTITFAPTTSGSASATLSITSNASNAAASVSLAGSGQSAFANLVITPASVNFGNINLNTKSTQNVTLQNTGDINLTIQGVTVAGAGFGYSGLSTGVSLAPNQTVTFQVWFSPTVAGQAAATVSFLSPSLSSPGTLSLSGDGVSSSGGNPPPPTQHSVQLSWNASTSQVIGYIVYRSEAPNPTSYSPLFGTALNQLTYSDSTVSSGSTYYYVVTAVDAAGTQSAYSNQVTAVIP